MSNDNIYEDDAGFNKEGRKKAVDAIFAAVGELTAEASNDDIRDVLFMLKKIGVSEYERERVYKALKASEAHVSIKASRAFWTEIHQPGEDPEADEEAARALAEFEALSGEPFVFPPSDPPTHIAKEPDGRFWLKLGEGKLCTPWSLLSTATLQDEGGVKAHRLKVWTGDREFVETTIHAGVIASKQGLLKVLGDLGIGYAPDNGDEYIIKTLAMSHMPGPLVHSQGGFHLARDGKDIYLHPNGTVAFMGEDGPEWVDHYAGIELAKESRLVCQQRTAGSYEALREATHKAFNCPDALLIQAAVLLGVAGPLNQRADMDGFLTVLAGPSNQFKTSFQEIESSAWGHPELNKGGVFISGDMSPGGYEKPLVRGVGSAVNMDETSGVPAGVVVNLSYQLQQNQGKKTMTRSRGEAHVHRFPSCVASISAEDSIVDQLAAEDKQIPGGLAVRVICYQMTAYAEPTKAIQAAGKAIRENWGWTGQVIVNQLFKDGWTPKRLQDEILKNAKALKGADIDDRLARGGRIWGLMQVIGKILKDADHLPASFDEKAFVDRLWEKNLLSAFSPFDPITRATEDFLGDLFAKKGNTVVAINEIGDRYADAVAYYGMYLPEDHVDFKKWDRVGEVPDNTVYVVRNKAMAKMVRGASPEDVRKRLHAQGALVLQSSGKGLTWSYWAGLARTGYTVIRTNAIEYKEPEKAKPVAVDVTQTPQTEPTTTPVLAVVSSTEPATVAPYTMTPADLSALGGALKDFTIRRARGKPRHSVSR